MRTIVAIAALMLVAGCANEQQAYNPQRSAMLTQMGMNMMSTGSWNGYRPSPSFNCTSHHMGEFTNTSCR